MRNSAARRSDYAQRLALVAVGPPSPPIGAVLARLARGSVERHGWLICAPVSLQVPGQVLAVLLSGVIASRGAGAPADCPGGGPGWLGLLDLSLGTSRMLMEPGRLPGTGGD